MDKKIYDALIASTLTRLAQVGVANINIAATALAVGIKADVAERIFPSNTDLLVAVAAYLSNTFYNCWQPALNTSKPDAASRLQAIVSAGFEERCFNITELQAWYALWRDPPTAQLIRPICAAHDECYRLAIEDCCAPLAQQHGLAVKPISQGFIALLEGLRLEAIESATEFNREQAHNRALNLLHVMFPLSFENL